MQKRIEYVDIAKGLLILLVLFNHICWQVRNNNIHNTLVSEMMNYFFLYTPFFMSAFFLITGLCSNYNKKFTVFLYNKIKTLLIPALFLGAIQNILYVVLKSPEAFEIKSIIRMFFKMILQIIYNGGQYWFLAAIFISNILFWLISKYMKKKFHKSLIIIALYCIGSILYFKNTPNVWSIQQALLLLPFIYIGSLLKGKEINFKYSFIGVIYFLIVYILQSLNISTTIVAARINLESYISPIIFIFLGSMGGITTIIISKAMYTYINKSNNIIQFIGKNSIIFYCLNWTILDGLIFICKKSLENNNPYYTLIILFMIFNLTINLIQIISNILNKKYINYMLGRF